MAVTVTHATVTAVPDDPAYDIGSDEWNAAHSVSGLGTAAESAATDFVAVVGDEMTGTLTSTLGTITTNKPAFSATQTWNDGAVGFVGWRLNVTNTAYDFYSSFIFDVQIGGVSKVWVNPVGGLEVAGSVRWGGYSGPYIDQDGANTGRIQGNWQAGASFTIPAGGVFKTTPVTVATLVAAGTAGAGARSFVTDATATTFASVVAGGGANSVPVYCDGANWLIG